MVKETRAAATKSCPLWGGAWPVGALTVTCTHRHRTYRRKIQCIVWYTCNMFSSCASSICCKNTVSVGSSPFGYWEATCSGGTSLQYLGFWMCSIYRETPWGGGGKGEEGVAWLTGYNVAAVDAIAIYEQCSWREGCCDHNWSALYRQFLCNGYSKFITGVLKSGPMDHIYMNAQYRGHSAVLN